MEAKMKTKPAETYRPFASDNKTGDWCLAIGVGTEWLVGRYATREEAVAVRKELVPGFVDDSGYVGYELLAPRKAVSDATMERMGGEPGSIGEATVAVDLLAMHRKREARRETRELLAKEARARKPGRMLRMMENKRTFGWAFDAEG